MGSSRWPAKTEQVVGGGVAPGKRRRAGVNFDIVYTNARGYASRRDADNLHRIGLIRREDKIYSRRAETSAGQGEGAVAYNQIAFCQAVPLGGVLRGAAGETNRGPIAGGGEVCSVGCAGPVIGRLAKDRRRRESAAPDEEEECESGFHKL